MSVSSFNDMLRRNSSAIPPTPAPTALVSPATPSLSPGVQQRDTISTGAGEWQRSGRAPTTSGLTNTFNQMLLSDLPTAQKFGSEIRGQGQELMGMGIAADERARADQAALAQQVGQYAQNIGQGPSLAELQQKQGLEAALQQQMAMAATQRGGNFGLQNRALAQNQANIATGMVGQAAQLRAQEAAQNEQLRMQAYGLQGGIQNALRGGDIQQQGLAQQQLQGLLAQQLGREQLGQQYFGQGLQVNRDVLNALTGREAARLQDDASKRAANAQQNAALIGAIGAGVGGYLG